MSRPEQFVTNLPKKYFKQCLPIVSLAGQPRTGRGRGEGRTSRIHPRPGGEGQECPHHAGDHQHYVWTRSTLSGLHQCTDPRYCQQ